MSAVLYNVFVIFDFATSHMTSVTNYKQKANGNIKQ